MILRIKYKKNSQHKRVHCGKALHTIYEKMEQYQSIPIGILIVARFLLFLNLLDLNLE